MDYVTHVISKQGWERVKCVNDYMMGIADTEEDISPNPATNPDCNLVITCDTGCQTPKEWLTSPIVKEHKEEERTRPCGAATGRVVASTLTAAPSPSAPP